MDDKPRILIIDDEEVVLDSCAQILEGAEFHVATANDGARGLERLQTFPADVVYVDLKMPGISGFEVLERIYALDPSIVTVVITGYATVGSAVEAMKKGAYDFLPKPFTPDEFRLITQRALEKRRLVLETMMLRREREMLREHFAAIVSHELKSPLGSVQQNLFALERELAQNLSENQKSRLERMKASVDSLLKLIHTWLRAYSTDLERISDAFKPTDLRLVISKAVESVQLHATRKDIEVLTVIEEPLGLVQGDEGTLVEAIVNLLGNAIKYSRLGSQVHVHAKEAQDSVLISVADTGVGIAREELPFVLGGFRVGKPGPEAERGSGLGLAIVQRIVQAHGGSLSVESEPGTGSTFTIRLPALPGNPPVRPEERLENAAKSQQGGTE